jgi:hypothetical protein
MTKPLKAGSGTDLAVFGSGDQVPCQQGGTGLDSSAAANGALLIGNGSGFSLATLTQGTNITITDAAGSITISATSSGMTNPMTTAGDIIYGGTSGTPTRLATTTGGVFVGGATPSYKAPVGGGLLSATSSTVPAWTAAGTAGQILQSAGAAAVPTWVNPPAPINYLINGSAEVVNGGTSTVANAQYVIDRWVMLTNSGSSTNTQVSQGNTGTPANNFCTNFQINPETTAAYVGLMQVIETGGNNGLNLAGQTVTFSGWVQAGSGTIPIRAAILGNTNGGTTPNFGGSVPRDPVLTWTSTTYTAGNFFRSTANGMLVEAVSSAVSATTSWVPFSVTATIGANVDNVLVMLWTVGTLGTTSNLNVAGMSLVIGSQAPPVYPARPLPEEYMKCARYFQSSYPLNGFGANSSGACVEVASAAIAASTAGTVYGNQTFGHGRMRTTPTVTLFSPNSGTSGSIYDISQGADRTGATAFQVGDTGFSGISLSTAGTQAIAQFNALSFQWKADAEI